MVNDLHYTTSGYSSYNSAWNLLMHQAEPHSHDTNCYLCDISLPFVLELFVFQDIFLGTDWFLCDPIRDNLNILFCLVLPCLNNRNTHQFFFVFLSAFWYVLLLTIKSHPSTLLPFQTYLSTEFRNEANHRICYLLPGCCYSNLHPISKVCQTTSLQP